MDLNFPKKEEEILKFWQKNKTFGKSIERRKKAPNFVFYEGPPTANAKPGIHHVLARIFKDVICRYKTMQGFKVLRKAGWDTHGLPVELEIEKKLGLKNKKDIEKYGIAKFNQECKESVWRYKKDWEELTERIGFWLDIKNPYITYETDYIETVWWILKKIYEKGLLYQDYKVVPYCSRCGTSLSSHEVALGYKNIKEPAIYVKFKVLNPEFKNSSLLVWTTTPWTLPGNVAVAVNPDFIYAKVKVDEECLILAKERIKASGLKGEILQEFKGKDLAGLRYESLYSPNGEMAKNAYRVIPAGFVSLEEGTGLVHIAPAFGEEDMEIVKTQNSKLKSQNLPEFPILMTVDESGKFTLDVKKWAGIFVKDADPLIVEDLKVRSLLFKEEQYLHDYPFCWRCDSPLLYYAKKSWFIRMTKVKGDLIGNNQKINWVPSHLKKGRFGDWISEIKDWAISRERYWGTPLPIWQCEKCGSLKVIGSKKDLINQKFSKNEYFMLRHGHSLRNVKNVVSCWPEKFRFPLTEKGEKQIKEAAKKLKNKKIDLIFSSDLLRNQQTAEIIGKELELKPRFDKRLREINVGILNGKPMDEAGRFWDPERKLQPPEYYSKRFQIKPPRGETYIDVEKRMHEFIREIDNKYREKNILIVSHQRPITLLEKVINGYDLKKFVEIIFKNKEIETGEIRKLEFKDLSYNEKMELDFHRPYVDKVKFSCFKCDNLMERVPEVIDCWFDSGSMPFAQYHYPFENKKLIDEKIQFPADYISEAVDQTRGWFYTLLAISTLLTFGPSYKNVISLSHVLDEKGEKMSKSKGNVVDPWKTVGRYGADAVRWYFFTLNQPGDVKLFSEKDVEGPLRRFIMTFWNCYLFYDTYADKLSLEKENKNRNQWSCQRKPAILLDKWVVSKLNILILEVANSLEEYDVTAAARFIEKFIIEDLSLWYIRRSRRRFQKPETKGELKEASQTLRFLLLTLSKLTASFIPFLSERIYRQLTGGKKSVHLESFPRANKKLIVKPLNQKMQTVRGVVAQALAERAKAKIKVRQPLKELKIKNYELKNEPELLRLIKEEINVKEIGFAKILALDAKITPELKEEGIIREVVRNIQEMRKKADFKPKDEIQVCYSGADALKKILEKNKNFILKEAKIKHFTWRGKKTKGFIVEKEIKVDSQILWIAIRNF